MKGIDKRKLQRLVQNAELKINFSAAFKTKSLAIKSCKALKYYNPII